MSGKVKILMGIPRKNLSGGPPTHLPVLVDYFEHHPSHSISTFYYGRMSDTGENKIQKVANTILTLFRFLIQLVKIRPGIVHINTAFDKMSLIRDVPFSLACLIFRQNLLFKLHGSLNELIYTKSRFYRFMIKLFFSGASKVGVLSRVEKEEFAAQFRTDKMVVVKNIVTPFAVTRESLNMVRKPGTIYGICVSRVVKEKGIDDILDALPLILSLVPAFRLVIAGDGPYLAQAQARAQELGINDFIEWTGHIENESVGTMLSSADIFIFTSHFPEGMPMALIEAVKCGLPVVTTRIRFAREHFTDGENCLFYDKTNSGELAQKVVTLASDKVLRNKITENNRNFLDQFSQEVVGKEFEAIYSSMLNRQ